MGIKQYKPTSAGRRAGSVSDFADCTYPQENKPEKSLLVPQQEEGRPQQPGRSSPSRFRGGGHKQMYRIIDFKRKKDGVEATVVSVEYDPNRTARIALLQYEDGEEGVHPRPGRPEGRRQGDQRRRRASSRGRQLHAAAEDPARHDGPQRRDAAGPRRPDLPQRRLQRDADRPRRRLGADHAADRRSPPRADRSAGRRSAACRTPST